MSERLKGKVALVTGAAQGIGEAIATLFAEEGARVAVTDIQSGEGEALASALRERGFEAAFFALDVADEDAWRDVCARAQEAFGDITVLANNAGVGVPRKGDGAAYTIAELALTDWERVMRINAAGVFLGTKHVLPQMIAAGGGSIVNISSITGMVGSRTTAYGASKGAVRVFTKSTAIEYAAQNIRCNSIHPGAVETPILERMKRDADLYAANRARHPLGRFGTPREIALGALYLASDEASFVTGAELAIDGGLTAQ